jgi:hypothetical protein
MRQMPAKSRSTAPTGPDILGEKQMDEMFRHQVNEGIRRNKPTVGAREETIAKFENEFGKVGMRHGR